MKKDKMTFSIEITDEKSVEKIIGMIRQEELKGENWLYQQGNSKYWD